MFYNFFFFFTPMLYIFVIKYNNLILLFILIIYNLFTIKYTADIDVSVYQWNYLPNYLKFNIFFDINDFLNPSIRNDLYIDYDINYQTLICSLDEIDYQIIPDSNKSVVYIRWDSLPILSESEEKAWLRNYDAVMEIDDNDVIRNSETYILKYVFRDGIFNNPDINKYLPVKYKLWRTWESVYVKKVLYEYKNSIITSNRWGFLMDCTTRRLHSKRKNGYLFRSFDTYLCWYYKYEFFLYDRWFRIINAKHGRITKYEFFVRKPILIALFLGAKGLGGLIALYLWFRYSPYP